MTMYKKTVTTAIIYYALACRSLPKSYVDVNSETSQSIPLTGTTIIPTDLKSLDSNNTSLSPKILSILQVPPGMLALSDVARPRAYLRQGPGTHFEVGDQPVSKGTSVIILAEIGVWKKVQLMHEGKVGWIHRRTLGIPYTNKIPVKLEAKNLPTVSTLRNLTSVEAFPTHERISMNVPKGSVFSFLRSNSDGFLVWLPVTNSVLWLKRRDAQ
jgi:hypothetical protein